MNAVVLEGTLGGSNDAWCFTQSVSSDCKTCWESLRHDAKKIVYPEIEKRSNSNLGRCKYSLYKLVSEGVSDRAVNSAIVQLWQLQSSRLIAAAILNVNCGGPTATFRYTQLILYQQVVWIWQRSTEKARLLNGKRASIAAFRGMFTDYILAPS